MLYRLPTPSVEGFTNFCKQQPPDAEFDYSWGPACAVGQYLNSIDRDWNDYSGTYDPTIKRLNDFARAAPHAYGERHGRWGYWTKFSDVAALAATVRREP